jgi:hypothetical protein
MTTAAATAYITNEMQASKNTIQTLIPGAAVNNFAYPYGEYTTLSTTIGQGIYTSQRTVECSTNTLDNLDYTKLKGCEVDAASTVDGVKALIDNAIAQKSWLILFYHEVTDTPIAGDEAYATTVADFTTIMQYIKSKQAEIDAKTVAQAIDTIKGVVTPKAGDVNGDTLVNEADMSIMFTNWGKLNATRAQGNLNGDTTVDEADMSVMFTNWSK